MKIHLDTSCPLFPLAPLHTRTWLGVGGSADILAIPDTQDHLLSLLSSLPPSLPLHILGSGSNLLIRDGGVRGVVLSLGKAWNYTRILSSSVLEAGASTPDMTVARAASKEALAGLEFMIGIPGSIGGAIRMNAGCFGNDTSRHLLKVNTLSRDGTFHSLSPDDLHYAYRSSQLPNDHIVLNAQFSLHTDNSSLIQERMKTITQQRKQRQPQGKRTGGSTFKNPPHHHAWQLIDKVGGRERSLGGAQFSPLHCNFLINNGNASAHDLEQLALSVQRDVLSATDVPLQWEIIRWGEIIPWGEPS